MDVKRFGRRRTTSPARWLTLFLAALVVGACGTGTGPDEDPDEPPTLPTASSMVVDFDLFAATGGGADAQATRFHFANAALRVLAAQAVTVVHLAVPTAVFLAAAGNTPSFEDGRWHWRYTASHGGELWTADLSGVVVGNEVDWDVRITAPNHDPPLDGFRWFGGTSHVNETEGTWRFYDPALPSTSSEAVRIDWSRASSDQHDVTITVTGAGSETSGDWLRAVHDGDSRTVTWYDASADTTAEIFWDAATGTGYIVAPGYNGGLKSCWDAGQNDIVCA